MRPDFAGNQEQKDQQHEDVHDYPHDFRLPGKIPNSRLCYLPCSYRAFGSWAQHGST